MAKKLKWGRALYGQNYDLQEAKRYPAVMELTGPLRNKPPTALKTKRNRQADEQN